MFDVKQLPITYNGYVIRQGMTWDADKNETTFHNYLTAARYEVYPKYINKDLTKHLVPLGGCCLHTKKFKSVKTAQKEIDAIISLGWYWMELCEREQEYVKNNLDMFDVIDEKDCDKKIVPTPANRCQHFHKKS